MIPTSLSVRTRFGPGRSFRVWIPLFLIWALLLPLVLVLFPLLLLVGLLVQVNAVRLYFTVWQTLSAMKDMLVEVENDGMAFQVRIH